MNVRVKICCISTAAEVNAVVRAGVDAVGFVAKGSARWPGLEDAEMAELRALLPPSVQVVLLTRLQSADAIVAKHGASPVDTIQLCNVPVIDELRRLRAMMPDVELLQTVHVLGPEAVAEARAVTPFVDGLLLDSGDPAAGLLGSTGQVHDWSISRAICAQTPKPVWLAGGLVAENVGHAIDIVKPDGIDVCTGVRGPGGLDPQRLAAFMAAARAEGR